MAIGDWVFYLLSFALGAAALWLFYISLLRDRSRGRRRCPKCWYDMSGAPPQSRTCSECGYTVKRERNLKKTRRRWVVACAAVLVMGLALVVSRGPRIARDGWAAVIPTTALVLSLPWIENHQIGSDWRAAAFNELFTHRMGIGSTTVTASLSDWQWQMVADRGFDQLSKLRAAGGSVQSSAYWYMLTSALYNGALHRLDMQDRYMEMVMSPYRVEIDSPMVAGRPVRFSVSSVMNSRERVPMEAVAMLMNGEPVDIQGVEAPPGGDRPLPHRGGDWAFSLPDSTGPIRLEFQIGDFVVKAGGKTALPVTYRHHLTRTASHLHEVLPPSEDEDIDRAIRSGFAYEIHVNDRYAAVVIRLSNNAILGIPEFDWYVGQVAIIRGRETIFQASRRFDITFDRAVEWGSAVAVFRLPPSVSERLLADAYGDHQMPWTIRFDLDVNAMLLWTRHPNMTYWPGVIEVPLDWARLLDER